MYLETFGLSEAPFSITPDPTFIYLSQRHREALAHLLFGVGQGGSGGFVQLTGEVGTGKTTLCRALLEQVPQTTRIALILNPLMNALELLEAICDELGIDREGAAGSRKILVDRLNHFLLDVHAAGGRVVVVIDEAQNLSTEALEQVRLLTNLETSKEKLLQIILLGQPELRDLLRRQSLRQLAQRITARYHLTPLNRSDTERYVRHRLEVAGASRCPFKPSAMSALYRRSKGVPRLINIIADRALLGAFAAEKHQIGAALVNAAADEVQNGESHISTRPVRQWLGAAASLAVVLLAAWWFWPAQDPEPSSASGAQARTGDLQASAPGSAQAPPAIGVSRAQPVQADLDAGDLPDQDWFERQDLLAWSLLADSWGRSGEDAVIEASCAGREGLGFACVREQGNLSRIRRLGLPVVLILPAKTFDGAEKHLFLGGLENSRLALGSADDMRWVERDALEMHWLGDYFVAWPQAPNWPREIERGNQGPAVDTLLRMAARADQPYLGPLVFDEAFEDWLIAFQSRNGLEADGIVGPRTLLYLMRFSIEEPRLLSNVQVRPRRN